MAESTIWWLLAGIAVAIELATGTFYLLMLAIGMVAAAIGAHLGLPVTGQLTTAAIFGGGAVALWHQQSKRKPKAAPAQSNPDVHIDIGEPVQVLAWQSDGTATVKYRGANWTAVLEGAAQAASVGVQSTGQFHIKEMLGNRLVIEKR